MGSGEGLCPPQLGVWGLALGKKINFALKKLCNSEQVLVLISYITAESGVIIPSPESGGPIPCPPPAPTPMIGADGRGRPTAVLIHNLLSMMMIAASQQLSLLSSAAQQ